MGGFIPDQATSSKPLAVSAFSDRSPNPLIFILSTVKL